MLKIDSRAVELMMFRRDIPTQIELARRSGLHVVTITRLLREDRPFTSDSVDKLAAALECSPLDLLSADGGTAQPRKR